MRRRIIGAGLAVVVTALWLPGCTSAGDTCMPAPLELSDDTVRIGTTVTLSAGPVACGLPDLPGTYRISYQERGGLWDLGNADVDEDGAFSTSIVVPTSATPGIHQVVVLGSAYDACLELQGASCVGYSVPVTVRP
ncbi:hypothetical protein [Cellulomonas soli]|uniref:hypothetical protein n=1 Tax=Cellulomonas soli TaxID=931535 RepID=UPI0011BF9542|nr:hypothetical protein [Cellulomonas soli]NYI58800.1 hypothetical protein [Cellulomonas soli]